MTACSAILSGANATGSQPITLASPSPEECHILESAAAKMGTQHTDLVAVLSGCPGPYATLAPSDQKSIEIGRLAANTPVPSEVRRRGLGHARLFSYLLVRGVPFEIIAELAETPLFAETARSFEW